MELEQRMEPIDYLGALGRRWYVIALAALVGVAAAFITTPSGQTTADTRGYQATHTLIVQDEETRAQKVDSLAFLATKGEVPERVAKKLDFEGSPEQLASHVESVANPELFTIAITAKDANPHLAVLV